MKDNGSVADATRHPYINTIGWAYSHMQKERTGRNELSDTVVVNFRNRCAHIDNRNVVFESQRVKTIII